MTRAVILLLVVGGLLWLNNLGICRLSRDWPLLLVVLGLLLLVRALNKNGRRRVIDRLGRGEISAEEAIRQLKRGKV